MSSIVDVRGRQILDSRGRPTVEVDIRTEAGSIGRASVPSGASTGSFEAHERRDGDPRDYAGLSVHAATAAINGDIGPALIGLDADDQRGLDQRVRELDGTPTLSRLGANAALGVSLAACRASAVDSGMPLFRRIAELAGTEPTLPMPMINILSGGLHAQLGMDVQDFLVVPVRAASIYDALHTVERVRAAAAELCAARGLSTLLADEGGLSPGFADSREALSLLVSAIEGAGLVPGADAVIAIDVAAHTLADGAGSYRFGREGRTRSTPEMLEMFGEWIRHYPIVSIEDALDEDDWPAWQALTDRFGGDVQLIGDDLFTTNAQRLGRGIEEGAANGILIKLNQNGTLTGTLDVVAQGVAAGYVPVISARSGETEDSFIADLAVGLGAGQIKVGSLRSSERLTKYNQLLRIAEDRTLVLAVPQLARNGR